MISYSIIPLDTDHLEEICLDVKNQYEKGVADIALFSFKITPQGNPLVDLVGRYSEKYILFRDKLKEYGCECGILVQYTLGHGGAVLDDELAFQPYVNLTDLAVQKNITCPADERTIEYFENAFEKIAKLSPELIMVDDDFRLMQRAGKGCACPLHIALFNERAGTDFSGEQLKEALYDNKEYIKIYSETQHKSLANLAKAIRRGIDKVNPKIQGAYCCCGTEPAGEIARILAGEGNPSIIRINNGAYWMRGTRGITQSLGRGALLKNFSYNKADIYLSESDTFPRNRYSTSASFMHTHLTGSILEGFDGTKHFITRLLDYEPKSGNAYREILSKNRRFYDALAEAVKGVTWCGAEIPLLSKYDRPVFGDSADTSVWSSEVLERLGLPFYFSNTVRGCVFMAEADAKQFSTEEMEELLKGNLVLSVNGAKEFEKNGFGKHLGVEVKAWEGILPTGEIICKNNKKFEAQPDFKQLVPKDSRVEVLSYAFRYKENGEAEKLFPAVTMFKNKLGGNIIVFCGEPRSTGKFEQVMFSYLNEARKEQLADILEKTENLPAYYVGDEEIYLRAGNKQNGEMLVSVINIGFDNTENICLKINKKITKARMLNSNGEYANVEFAQCNNIYTFNIPAKTLTPVILNLK